MRTTIMFFIYCMIIAFIGCTSNRANEDVKNLEKRIAYLETKITKLDSTITHLNQPKEELVQITCSLCSGKGSCAYCFGTRIYGGISCIYCSPPGPIRPTGFCKKCKGTGYILKKQKS